MTAFLWNSFVYINILGLWFFMYKVCRAVVELVSMMEHGEGTVEEERKGE